MRFLSKLLYYVVVLFAFILMLGTDTTYYEINNEERTYAANEIPDVKTSQSWDDGVTFLPNPKDPEPIGVSYVLKTFIAMLIIILGYLLSRSISSVLTRLEKLSETQKEHSQEAKYQRQLMTQNAKNIEIQTKRINKLEDWRNHHNIHHAKTDKQWNEEE